MPRQLDLFEQLDPHVRFSKEVFEQVRQKIERALLVPAKYLMTKEMAESMILDAIGDSAAVKNVQIMGDNITAEIELKHPLTQIGFSLMAEEE